MITDQEFRVIMSLEKLFTSEIIGLPLTSQKAEYQLKSTDGKHELMLDIDRRGKFTIHKCKLQNRIHSYPIIRVDIDSPPHTNPDGTTTSRNHIHIYREGYSMSWAYDLSNIHEGLFLTPTDFMSTFYDFCTYCNITNIPKSQGVI